jgi:hypothetical protein
MPSRRYNGDMADEAGLKAWVKATLATIKPAAR